MKITTEIKSRKFTVYEKAYLYGILIGPKKEEYNKLYSLFKKFLHDLVRRRLITDDIKFITSRPYCFKSNSISIDLNKLGLPKSYEVMIGDRTRSTSIITRFDLPEDLSFPVERDSGYYRYCNIDKTDDLLNNCTEDEINQLKENLLDLAKKYSEVEYFGIGTWIRDDSYYRYKFPDIDTWGQLLNKSPELFEKLYENYLDDEVVDGELRLIRDLKKVLGY